MLDNYVNRNQVVRNFNITSDKILVFIIIISIKTKKLAKEQNTKHPSANPNEWPSTDSQPRGLIKWQTLLKPSVACVTRRD